jgi:hypothetical protein
MLTLPPMLGVAGRAGEEGDAGNALIHLRLSLYQSFADRPGRDYGYRSPAAVQVPACLISASQPGTGSETLSGRTTALSLKTSLEPPRNTISAEAPEGWLHTER